MYIDTDFPIRVSHFGRTSLKGIWHGIKASKTNILMYVLDGSVTMSINSQVYHVNSGDILLIPKDSMYGPIECESISYFYIHFSAYTAAPSQTVTTVHCDTSTELNHYRYYLLNVSTIINLHYHYPGASTSAIQHIFNRLTQINIWQHRELILLVDNLLRELLILLNTNTANGNAHHPILKNITKYIDSHYREEINLYKLSEIFHLSTTYIAKLFKKELNTTLTQYINSVRTSIACNLLLNTELSIGEIAELAGFNHQHYFNKVFQKIYHTTPGQFRRSGPTV